MESGFLLIKKQSGPTSHDVIDQLRKITGIKKIGHAGTLDPFASGLLIVAVGRESTKRLGGFLKLDKSYVATVQFGATSDTCDREGMITENTEVTKTQKSLTQESVEGVLEKFRGEIEQVPPMFSAKKVKGKKLYELARAGVEIERKPVSVTIHELVLDDFDPVKQQATLSCSVSSGTYIRSLGYDIGQELGMGAYLEELRRTKIGDHDLKDAVELSELNSENWQGYLRDLP